MFPHAPGARMFRPHALGARNVCKSDVSPRSTSGAIIGPQPHLDPHLEPPSDLSLTWRPSATHRPTFAHHPPKAAIYQYTKTKKTFIWGELPYTNIPKNQNNNPRLLIGIYILVLQWAATLECLQMSIIFVSFSAAKNICHKTTVASFD